LYNTGGYENVETLKLLEGLIDIYLPDLKYVTPTLSQRFSGASDYFAFAAPALQEMQRQVGTLNINQDGIAVRGLMVRHLVLPGCVDETRRVLDHIRDTLPLNTWISLMRQYTPMTELPSPLNRRLTIREYERAATYCMELGLTNVLLQEEGAADTAFTPQFFDKV
jgi:putative pyruvate formate lyase activating enzyme